MTSEKDFLSNPIPLAYEVRDGTFEIYEQSLDAPISNILESIQKIPVLKPHNLGVDLQYDRGLEGNPCWILTIDSFKTTDSPARKARLHIAHEIGLMPALFYDFLPEYKENLVQLYGEEFTVCCTYRHPYCIRPSHLRVCNRLHIPIQTLFTFQELLDIRSILASGAASGSPEKEP